MDDTPKKDNHEQKLGPEQTESRYENPGMEEEIPLTPMAWLAQNAIYFLIIGAIAFMVVSKHGFGGLIQAGMIAVGLGFVIFIHELGHFLVAKWCDVHVLTFSVGFGPAIPGCSFKRGETVYKISLLPLGGYVNMVGEGMEMDEEEDYPRSFKNKTVGQRMAIISAGVIMNVLLAAVCFIIIFMGRGMVRLPADVQTITTGGPAWKAGVRDDWSLQQMGDIKRPHFEQMKMATISAGEGNKIRFVFQPPGESQPVIKEILPYDGGLYPIVGLGMPPDTMKIALPEDPKVWSFFLNSAFGASREIDVPTDSVIVATSDPEDPSKMKALPDPKMESQAYFAELSQRMWALGGEPFQIQLEGQGKPLSLTDVQEVVKAKDQIIALTDENQKDSFNPFKLKPLPIDPRHPETEARDSYAFRNRLKKLADKPIVIQLQRTGEGSNQEKYSLLIPSNYRASFGFRMKMGEVAALRDESAAVEAGVKPGDILSKVTIVDNEGKTIKEFKNLDPVRLPAELQQAMKAEGAKVKLTVLRPNPTNHKQFDTQDLKAVKWDTSWSNNHEEPGGVQWPMSIPELGIAYYVEPEIQEIVKGSPAEKAELQVNDIIEEVRFYAPGEEKGSSEAGNYVELMVEKDGKKYRNWSRVPFILNDRTIKKVDIKVRRPGQEDIVEKTLTATFDTSWYRYDREIPLRRDIYFQKADNLLQALGMGASETVLKVQQLYLQIKLLVTGRVSTKALGGPVEILSRGFEVAGAGFTDFLFFIGFISVNLAVINFLPIPLLDGGHMVFLIYEKLRGKPAPESIRMAANYIGLALLLTLMVYVFYLDIKRRFFGA